MYTEAIEAPEIVVVTVVDHEEAIEQGRQLYMQDKDLSNCENEWQEVGWWQMFQGQTYAEYAQYAVRRNVPERDMELPRRYRPGVGFELDLVEI